MARERARGEQPTEHRGEAGWRADLNLSRAEAAALSRSAPLTQGEFRALGRIAEQRIDALRVVLDGGTGAPRPPGSPDL